MQSHEILREAIDKIGVKAVAGELRLSPALVYKWCEPAEADDPDASGARNPLDRLRDIIHLTEHVPLVNWLCHEAGGFFVHNPEEASPDIDADLLQSTQHLVLGFSQLLNEVSGSVADDGHIERDESERIRRGWEALKTTAETFVVACERGLYRKKVR